MRSLDCGVHCQKVRLLRDCRDDHVRFLKHRALRLDFLDFPVHFRLHRDSACRVALKVLERAFEFFHGIVHAVDALDHFFDGRACFFHADSLCLDEVVERADVVGNLADVLDSLMDALSLISDCPVEFLDVPENLDYRSRRLVNAGVKVVPVLHEVVFRMFDVSDDILHFLDEFVETVAETRKHAKRFRAVDVDSARQIRISRRKVLCDTGEEP